MLFIVVRDPEADGNAIVGIMPATDHEDAAQECEPGTMVLSVQQTLNLIANLATAVAKHHGQEG